MFFWDDSAGSTAFLAPGSTLAITTTTIDVADAGITDAKLRNSSALSVIGRSVNSTGVPADIIASTDGHVLRRSGTSLGFGTLAIGSMSMNTARILGRTTASVGAVEELTVSSGLTLASGNLRLGGILTQNTSITGGGFNFTGTGYTNYHFVADDVAISTTSAGINIKNVAAHQLTLGESGGVTFNIGSDATNDMYYRNLSGKFDRIPIGTAGQQLIVETTGSPIWADLRFEDVSATTYSFVANDNNKIKRFTSASGCVVTIPVGLPVGWQSVAYRASGAGVVSFTSAGTLESAGTSLPSEKTLAAVMHRGSNVHILSGAVTTAGTGTVTSVGLSGVTGILSVASSPIVTNGTMALSLDTQPANFFLGGPVSGASAVPTVRALVLADLPNEVFEDVTGTTYTFLDTDNKKIKRFTNVAGCVVTIPTGLPTGWSSIAYRGATAGVVTFTSLGTYEGVSNAISTQATAATIVNRGSDIHVGLVPSSGGGGGGGSVSSVGLAAPSFLSVSGSPVTSSGTLVLSYSGTALPTANGGTGLTALGTSNQILAMNNAGTGLEYKTVSVSGTAVSNDVGVTLTGANALVINLPSASATVRGLTTTGTQTFSGAKTYSTSIAITPLTSTGILVASTGGLLTTPTNFLYGGGLGSGGGINIGTGAITTNQVLRGNLTVDGSVQIALENSSTGASANTGITFSTSGAPNASITKVSTGSTSTYGATGALWIQDFSTGGINIIGGNAAGRVILGAGNPVSGAEKIRITPSGVAISTSANATAKLHIAAGTATANTAPIKLATGGTLMSVTEAGAIESTNTHIYWTDNAGARWQLDQQGGGGGGGITNSAGNTELMRSDGTNATPSGVFIPTAGSLTLGSGAIAGDRTITVASSSTNSTLELHAKGSSGVVKLVPDTSASTTNYFSVAKAAPGAAPPGMFFITDASPAISAVAIFDYRATAQNDILTCQTHSDKIAISAGTLTTSGTSKKFVIAGNIAAGTKPASNLELYGGDSGVTAQGGDTLVRGGDNTSSGLGGTVTIRGGNSSSGTGGNVNIYGGDGTTDGNIGLRLASFGSGQGVIAIGNATVVPSTNPTGGGILYIEGGALKFRGSSGTITTIANA